MPLTDPDHDQPHLDARTGQTVDKVDQTSSMTLMGLAVAGALAVTAIHLMVG